MTFNPKEIAAKAIEHGYAPIPWFKNDEGEWQLRKFINKQTGDYGYPIEDKSWSRGKEMPMVSLVLLNTLLVDIDGNKTDTELDELKQKVCEVLGIDEFDLDLAEFQINDAGDSIHYLFRLPDGIGFDTVSQSNDGKLIKNVDFKTGRQLVHLKPNKTLMWAHQKDLPVISEDALFTILKPTVASDDEFEILDNIESETTSKYGHGALRSINTRATAFVEEGQRNACLAAAVVSIYELVAGGEICAADATEAVAQIVEELGIGDESDTQTTIDFNAKKGLRQPKRAPKREIEVRLDEKRKVLVDDVHRDRVKHAIKGVKRAIVKEIGFTVDVDLDIAHIIVKSCFWQPKECRVHTINPENARVIFSEADSHHMLTTFFGNPVTNFTELCDWLKAEEMTITDQRKYQNMMIKALLDIIKAYNQRLALSIEVDMFTDHTHFEFEPDRAIVKHKHIPMKVLYPVVDDVALSEYKAHFPQINDLVDMMVAARFASSRKKAYVWLKAPSDWGKDFFRVALGSVCVEMSVKEVEKALEGGAVGKSADSFHRTFVMVTNEFKNVKSELKQLEDGITLSAKYQLETRVPLYTKLFMSAEGVDSLVGEHGVEAQFANRFSMIECSGNINKLPSFSRLGGNGLLNVVKTYLTQRINDRISHYRKLGVVESLRQADSDVFEFHRKYSIGNSHRLIEDSIDEVANLIRDELIRQYADLSYCDDDFMYLTSPKTRIKDVLFNGRIVDRSEAGTLKHKTDEICAELSDDKQGIRVVRIEGKLIKCIRVPLVADFEEIYE